MKLEKTRETENTRLCFYPYCTYPIADITPGFSHKTFLFFSRHGIDPDRERFLNYKTYFFLSSLFLFPFPLSFFFFFNDKMQVLLIFALQRNSRQFFERISVLFLFFINYSHVINGIFTRVELFLLVYLTMFIYLWQFLCRAETIMYVW